MPYARVGVIPPLTSKNDQQSRQMSGGKRNARRKGITMEDLKKLTALRLAQEQQQQHHHNSPPNFAESRSNPSVTAYSGDQAAFTLPNVGTGVVNVQPVVAPCEPVPCHLSSDVVLNPIEGEQRAILRGPSSDVHDLQASTLKQPKKVLLKKAPMGQAPSPVIVQSPVPDHRNHEHQSRFQRSPDAPPSTHSGSPQLDVSYQGSSQQPSAKSKLPHGLTVHELKEMTKARLQAEAAEKSDIDIQKTVHLQQPRGSPSPRLNSPNHLFFHPLSSVESSSPKQPIREHHLDVYPPPSPAFQTSFGAPVQLNSALSEVSESEFVGNLERSRSSGVNQSRDCWQQQSKTDTWETASVASYNSAVASEYLGSESPFTPVIGGLSNQIVDDLGNVPFGRSRSYPTSGGFAVNSEYQLYEGVSSNNSASFGNVYVAVGPNRRRACTLSPRPGLSNLHEDRPMLSGEGLGMPSFSTSTTRAPINPRGPNSYSPILSHSQYPENFRTYGNFSDSISRPRTLSTASLPPISHTADEFALEGRPTRLQFSMGPPVSQSFPDPHGAAMDSFLHSNSSLSSAVNTSSGVAAVFRGSGLGEDIGAPPGLFGGTELRAMSTSSSAGLNLVQSSGSDTFCESKVNSKMDSTWGDSHGSVFPLGTGMIQHPSDPLDATLAGDLNSILKLSGAAEESDPVLLTARNGFHDMNGADHRPFGF